MTIPELNRRTAVAGAGALVAAATLTACSTYGKDDAPDPAKTEPAAPGTSGANGAGGIAKTADIPVGGGKIIGSTVLTQPAAGQFVGLDATCTHAGCKVNEIAGGTINCPCHGSKFNLDGSVANGPATRPLKTKSVRVEGDSIVEG
ncbi:Rieske (2Fe-2S) protein [Nocardia goodfellowii]|uniref:Cytochrome bc1 complex Rieske iron-sulfur subunit n=1 Tax=Nocardia goodfellowii TaxID=882446 RepID=A0ABS4QRC5_9NOCA|nr:Rieske (2Fe-2S) protein [Nocardia goodfellowii]MBP2193715.1 Rieske Fe-S protein [Nocardia goodfellowii]